MITELQKWVEAYAEWLWAISIASFIFFVGSLIVVPWMVVRMPADYFLDEDDPRRVSHTAGPTAVAERRMLLRVLKNLCGVALVMAGIAMLLLPGQGVLTMLIGVSLVDFPGKRGLERAIIRRPRVLQGLNWMRSKAHQPPLIVDPVEH